MKVIICKDYESMSKKGAEIIAERTKSKPDIVLGLATGSTPEGLYAELARMCEASELSFKQARTFNLDEYQGLAPEHHQSYRHFMNTEFFDHIDIEKANTRVLNGQSADPAAECAKFEDEIKAGGGIDLQLLGIGSNGHIGFAEPGSPKDGRTSLVDLTASTIRDNSRLFSRMDEVPKQALSMGIGTILEAQEIVLVASSESKVEAIAACVEGDPSTDCPASLLRDHPNLTFVIDEAAGSKLQNNYERA